VLRRFLLPFALICLAALAGWLTTMRELWVLLLPALGMFVLLVGYAYRGAIFSATGVVVVALLLRVALFPVPPTLSDDAYRYIWDGEVQRNGVNPYSVTPEEVSQELRGSAHLFDNLNSQSYYSVYPPLSQLTFRAAVAVGGPFPGSWYVLKALFVLVDLAVVVMLIRAAGARLTILYAWNPLVLIEIAGQAHTEVLATAFLMVGVLASRSRRPLTAGVSVALAGMVKLYPFLLAPDLARRFGWKAILGGVAGSIALAAIYWTPEAVPNALSSLVLYAQYFEFNAALYQSLKWLGGLFFAGDVGRTLGPLLAFASLAFVVVTTVVAGRRDWPFERVALWILGGLLILSTTVHPWYLVPILAMTVVVGSPGWHWQALSVGSLCTYARYVDGPYGVAVALGWAAFAVIALVSTRDAWVQALLRLRARSKARRIIPHLPPEGISVLDLGAGEGYVAEQLRKRTGAALTLIDVEDTKQTDLPFLRYDGRRLPFDDEAFDAVVVVYVLHHSASPEGVIAEARRVTARRVIVIESVYESRFERWLLHFLDTGANRLRGGWMRAQEPRLEFRMAEEWRSALREAGLSIEHEERFGGFWHRQVLFVANPIR
jgi:alpha-1,6-mannosyltransferase